jgi:hypothetical protein
MKQELEAKFIKEFPNWFDELQFGFECGDGWFDLLWNMCVELRELGFDTGFAQIKEKFAGLRAYANGATDEQWKVIGKAEEDSENTCEECGQPGKLRERGWMYLRCDKCWEELLLRYNK